MVRRSTIEKFHQTLAIIPVALDQFTMGLGYGWLAPTLQKLEETPRKDLLLSTSDYSLIGSLHCFARLFAPIAGVWILEKFGRRAVFLSYAVVTFAVWVVLLLVTSVPTLYFVRVLFGLAGGMLEVSDAVYIGENANATLRGVFGCITILCFYGGMLLEFILATYLSYANVVLVNAVLTFVSLLSTFLLTEPVQFLILKGKTETAKQNLMWLRGVTNEKYILTEFEIIKEAIEKEKSKGISLRDIRNEPSRYKSMWILLILYFLVPCTGYEALTTFASMAFEPSTTFTENEYTILLGFTQFFALCATVFVIERVGRRSFILMLFTLAALVNLCSAVLYYVNSNVCKVPYFPWLIFITVSVYCTIFAIVLPAVYILRGELFPINVKGVGGCLCIISSAGMEFATTVLFLVISSHMGIYFNFVVYSVCSAVVVLYVNFVLPETRGKTLIQIQEDMEKEYTKS